LDIRRFLAVLLSDDALTALCAAVNSEQRVAHWPEIRRTRQNIVDESEGTEFVSV
jgi:hypothetical protein